MKKPTEYQNTYIVNRNLPYRMTETQPSGDPSNGGVLGRGQLVWMQQELEPGKSDPDVVVFAEEIGFICLDPRLLSRVH